MVSQLGYSVGGYVGDPPSEQVIGSCSCCGGDVVIYTAPWAGVTPPKPHCVSCGAGPAEPTMPKVVKPVIPMAPRSGGQFTLKWGTTTPKVIMADGYDGI